MTYDASCQSCPYLNQAHLIGSCYVSRRPHPPIALEDNGSDTLLVFQSPGVEEWAKGLAIQPTKKQGGTAGSRVLQSWGRSKKSRADFNIINAVQCFPGNEGQRDLDPLALAVSSCTNRLRSALAMHGYSKIIAFGDIAQHAIAALVASLNHNSVVINARHPNSGISRETLDALW